MSAWIVSKRHIDQLVYGAIRLGVIHPESATDMGAMLTRANIKSIRARYGQYDEGAAAKAAQGPYRYREPRDPIDDVSLLKQVNCYDYQTCEFDAYMRSRARSFVVGLETALKELGVTRDSPGYNEAPWGL
jgi:hypothetical protein